MAEQHEWQSTGRGTHRCTRCGVHYHDDQRERAPECEPKLERAVCLCGHLVQEHAPQWCCALACECRAYRAAEGAS